MYGCRYHCWLLHDWIGKSALSQTGLLIVCFNNPFFMLQHVHFFSTVVYHARKAANFFEKLNLFIYYHPGHFVRGSFRRVVSP